MSPLHDMPQQHQQYYMEIGSVHNMEGGGGHNVVHFGNSGAVSDAAMPSSCPLSMRRPTAGPQSMSSSIRRKSTIYDHSAGPGGVKNGPSTPERPLLYAFNDPVAVEGATAASASPVPLSQQHIYMEVADPPPPTKKPQQQFQPIHIPILVERRTESSNSSQSSGYYSEYRPPSSSRELKLQQQQQQQQPQQLKPKQDLPEAARAGGFLSPGRQLQIQDSQFI